MATLHSFEFKMTLYTHNHFLKDLDTFALKHMVNTLLQLEYLQIKKKVFYFQIKTDLKIAF